MKNKTIIAIALLILLTTITSQQKILTSKLNLKTIKIDNNFLIKEKDIKNLLASIYGKNLLFLKNKDIKRVLLQNNLIESFEIRKVYPNILKIKIFEKKPIAVLIKDKNKFFLTDKVTLIEFKNYPQFKNLPYVIGDQKSFKIFYDDIKKSNFPFHLIKRFTLYETNRWDLETNDGKVIKLPTKNYLNSLKNYLDLNDKKNFQKYKSFDYRINNQLILK
jgi:cell division septal protein FtsQ